MTMTQNEKAEAWSVWIDKQNKIISVREIPKGKELVFKSTEAGIKSVSNLVKQGYKIG